MCGLEKRSMQLETKFLRLKFPVTIGSRFDDWEVCWVPTLDTFRTFTAQLPLWSNREPAVLSE